MKKNTYCPDCLEQDGLRVVLDNLKCPQCSTQFIALKTGLVVEDEDFKENYAFSVCKLCGGRHVSRTYATNDGFDEPDWNQEDWCEDCDGMKNTAEINNLLFK